MLLELKLPDEIPNGLNIIGTVCTVHTVPAFGFRNVAAGLSKELNSVLLLYSLLPME